MNAAVYYLIFAVAAAFGCCLFFMNNSKKKRKQEQAVKPLNEKQKRALAHGAILAYMKGDALLSVHPHQRPEENVRRLRDQWGIIGKEDAVNVLNILTDLQKTEELNVVLENSKNEGRYKKLVSKIARELKISAGYVARVNDTVAWDTCRAVNVAKWCFWAGYLTEKEAWGYMLIASGIAMERCSNWRDYTLSFLLGRSLHGFDPDDLLVYCDRLLKGSKEKARAYTELSFK